MPYPPIETWRIPGSALQATLEGVRPAGQLGRESGAFWLGRRSAAAEVTTVVLPRPPGVVEARGSWQVSPELMAAITRWAKPQGLVMLGMLHIHGGDWVGLSWSDRNRTVQVPGILSVIAPHGGAVSDPDRWGWYLYDDASYRVVPATERKRRIVIDAGASCSTWVISTSSIWPVH